MEEIITKDNLDTYTQGLKGVLSSMGEAINNAGSSDETKVIVNVRSEYADADLSSVIVTVVDMTTGTEILKDQNNYYHIPVGHVYEVSVNPILDHNTPVPITRTSAGGVEGILVVYEVSGFVDMGLPSGLKWSLYPLMIDGDGNIKNGSSEDYVTKTLYTSWGNVYRTTENDSNYVTSPGNKLGSNIPARSNDCDAAFLSKKYMRIPSWLEWMELINNSTCTFRTIYYPSGRYAGYSFLSDYGIELQSKLSQGKIYLFYTETNNSLYKSYYWSSTGYSRKAARVFYGYGYTNSSGTSASTSIKDKNNYAGICPVFCPSVRKTQIKITTSDNTGVEGLKLIIKDSSGEYTYTTDSSGEAFVWTEGLCTIKCTTHNLNISLFSSGSSVSIVATRKEMDYGFIIIDQTSVDPYKMIVNAQGQNYTTGYIRPGVIDSIREASHCYVGTYNSSTQIMQLKQLDDADGTKYADGTDASNDITSSSKYVWMRLPEFYTRATEIETDKWKIEFAFDTTLTSTLPDGNGWKKWGGNDLIGKYISEVGPNYISSRSGITGNSSNSACSKLTYSQLAISKGVGFSLMKWKHFNIFRILYYAYYGTTDIYNRNGFPASGTFTTGFGDLCGMADIISYNAAESGPSFWGIEGWTLSTWIDNISCPDTYVYSILEDDGSTRLLIYNTDWISGYMGKAILGDNLDMLPKKSGGVLPPNPNGMSASYLGYKLNASYGGPSDSVVVGVSNISHNQTDVSKATFARLAYKGNIEII